jgi:alpha,alpha-trehalose-phosphate synthase [UDP-forming]
VEHGTHRFVVVANRLPVDVSVTLDDDGAADLAWQRSPGGLVTALGPVMRSAGGAWVGWGGAPDLELEPFDAEGMRLWPVPLTAEDVATYYEGFSNATIWPLYHDVVVPPEYHREWWASYVDVNERFAQAAAAAAAPGAVVWVHDYQLQMVPAILRSLRPDVRIGYFHHIPFPALEIFSQLPWRRPVIEGLLGADLIGFQRSGDVATFLRAVRRFSGATTKNKVVTLPSAARGDAAAPRRVRVGAFPISIDSGAFDALARSAEIAHRAKAIRQELGDPDVVLLGVDRLDYTKGIAHRLKAFGELLRDQRLTVPGAVLVQVASPSREHVEHYRALRDEVELIVGRINGDHGTLGHPAVHYLHQAQPPEEMAALYLAADVLLVTSLRDGMNLVAKEYVAARHDGGGVLVLSEFAGAADELTQAIRINPHDIDAVKAAIMQAISMDRRSAQRRMAAMRRRVLEHDVTSWSSRFLAVLRNGALS